MLHPDGKTLISASGDKTLKVWHLESGKVLQTLQEHTDSIWSAIQSQDGIAIATGSADNTTKIWQCESP